MEIDQIKQLIESDRKRRETILKSKEYYKNNNDIEITGVNPASSTSDPMRNADNRISHNFHQLLVDEKASYMFSYPVLIDVEGNDELTNKVKRVLGVEYISIIKDLCIEASNCAYSYLHYWTDSITKKFEYALVKTEQIIPMYSNTLKRKLIGVYRYYETTCNGEDAIIFERWTATDFEKYTLKGNLNSSEIKLIVPVERAGHSFGRVPFIEFKNNNRGQNDLIKYKKLIDLYDKVMSGYANDMEDIQEIIYILENYGGEDLGEFLGDLKRYKAVKTETDGVGSSGAVKTMQIEIPVEARNSLLKIVKDQIYESGQGLQQSKEESFGDASGVALKFFYRKLELKAGLTEVEFTKSIDEFIKAILLHLTKSDDYLIEQTYTRNMISNDLENTQIANLSASLLPRKLLYRNHPWVRDPEEAERLKDLEEGMTDPYDQREE